MHSFSMFMQNGKMAGIMENIKGTHTHTHSGPEAEMACKLLGIFKARNMIKNQGDKTDI